jgi:secreted trypsin-like serine protease
LFAQESKVAFQIGLVSFGTNLCGRGIPGVYTKVAAYLPWIESKMEV